MGQSSQKPTAASLGAGGALRGQIKIPGDKSISHRVVMFGGMAKGETRVSGLLEGEDVMATAAAMRAMGALVERLGDGEWRITGAGLLQEPAQVLDMGNSGTSCRLLMGILAGQGFSSCMTGDASLVTRPMGRVTRPLEQMGASFISRDGGRLPLAIKGGGLAGIDYAPDVASAQVKSAILLAGLFAQGTTRVTELAPTRDHTERMLPLFGASCQTEGLTITLEGGQSLTAPDAGLTVPADPSSAGFFMVAASIVPGSEVELPGVSLNPGRIGLIDSLLDMGADITISNHRSVGAEPVGDITIRHARLHGATIPADRAPSMIDEYPVLAMAAACATGVTRMEGVGELRVKESDRLLLVAQGLDACGVPVRYDLTEGAEWLEVTGSAGAPVAGGARIETALDHRIAMSFLTLSLVASSPVTVDDAGPIATSFPTFQQCMEQLGATWHSPESAPA
ncbi:MAG: 3-phosphoshikimate 1-carboxyvinyltransferase [Alphaproteobacteria bacterium]